MNRWLGFLMMVLVGGMAGDFWWHYAALPVRVASHFNAAGAVDGFMGRDAFGATMLGTVVGMAVLFWGMGFFLPRIPVGMINLPRKEYWMSEENREETFRFMRGCFSMMGLLTVGLLAVVFHLSIEANLRVPPVLGNGVWIVLGVFGVGMAGWMIYICGAFFAGGMTG